MNNQNYPNDIAGRNNYYQSFDNKAGYLDNYNYQNANDYKNVK
jgi:hypothetical protein